MDAEYIEFNLRSSIQGMFTETDEAWNTFSNLDGEAVLQTWVRRELDINKAEINRKKQIEFWNAYLEPLVAARNQ